MPDEIRDADAVAGVLVDEDAGAFDETSRGTERPRAVARDDAAGCTTDRLPDMRGVAPHHRIEPCGRAEADLLVVGQDAGKGRRREIADDAVVVDPEHRDLPRYPDAESPAAFDHLRRAGRRSGRPARPRFS